MPYEQKSGNRNNADDRKRIRDIRSAAKQIHDISMEMEPNDTDTPDFVVEVKSDASPQGENAIKAAFVKAAGEYELDVLGVPYGGPKNGKDTDGEYFDATTELALDTLTPLVTYYHGIAPDGKGAQTIPEVIGSVTKHWQDERGHWFRVVLDKASEYARRVWEAAKRGLARASSGSVAHLVRKDKDGRITYWPMAELALIDAEGKRQPANAYAVALPALKTLYEKTGLEMPAFLAEKEPAEAANPGAGSEAITQPEAGNPAENPMEESTMAEELEAKIEEALTRREAAKAEAEKAEAARKAAIDEAVKAAKSEWDKEAAKSGRLPTVNMRNYAGIDRYESLDLGETCLAAAVLKSAGKPVPNALLQSAAAKAMSEKGDPHAVSALKAAGFAGKSDEVMHSDLSSYGDDWVMAGYSGDLWNKIRFEPGILNRVPQVEIPQGVESMKFVLESTDPTFYKVSETSAEDSTMKTPVASVTSSKAGTTNQSMTLAKMGARVQISGELEEDSIVPMISQIRAQLVAKAREELDTVLIDGDTETAGTTNINDIGGTPAGTETFMLLNGFRKLALVTNTANSRSAAGGLTADDYLETVKLMGTAGINALDLTKIAYIVDPNTYWKSMQLADVRTRDVFGMATLENGQLRKMWGYDVLPTPFMHAAYTTRKANTAGKVDVDTVANNAYGAILAVRFDQWKFGWKRRLTIESNRIARADVTEVVALLRFGLIYRDTEASAITYYVGV